MAFASDWTINVNTAMSPAGEKLPHPTPDQPAYYYPYCVGYQEAGTVEAGAKKLSADVPIIRYLAEALASQGYLVTHVAGTKLDPPPSLLLVFRWGYMHSFINEEYPNPKDAGEAPTPPEHPLTTTAAIPQYNERAHLQELILVGVQERDLFDNRLSKSDLVASADDQRYFVTIAAYDFATYYTQHKKILLWVSKMSIPRQDLELDDVVAPLIKTGTPFLGRETVEPRVVDIGDPNGRGKAGTPVFKGYVAPAAAQPPAPSQH